MTDISSEIANDPEMFLTKKIISDIETGNSYDALQYVQSFIARKKKSLGPSETSRLIFSATRIMFQNNASLNAAALLEWFLKGGAGVDNLFSIRTDKCDRDFCDLERLIELLSSFSSECIGCIVERVYIPVFKLADKNQDSKQLKKLKEFEEICANAFEASRLWANATKSVLRLGYIERGVRCIDAWAREGFKMEYPLFFARAALQLLLEGQYPRAADLVSYATPLISRYNAEHNPTDEGPYAASWHLAVILVDLASPFLSSSQSRKSIDKAQIFTFLYNNYEPILASVDPKLILQIKKIGEVVFGIRTQQTGFNPMALLSNMMGGAGGQAAPGGGIDLKAMMDLLM